MSMMMKLINAAAGQVQGDLIYFISGNPGSSSSLTRLSSVNVDSGEVRHGANFAATGVYSDAGTDFYGNPIGSPNYFGTWGYSATTMAVGDDDYIYVIGQTNLSSTHSNTGPYTDFLMRFNPSSLNPDPGFFYNMLNQVSNGLPSGASMATDFCFHPPSGSVIIAGGSTNTANGQIVASQVVKIDPWPSTPVDAQASGYYHSSTNTSGRIYGSITTGENTAVKNNVYNTTNSVNQYRARVETNGSDIIALGTWSTNVTDGKLHFKKDTPNKPVSSTTTTTNAQRPSPDPFTAMTGQEFPLASMTNASWRTSSTGGSANAGIAHMWYRPGNTTNNTPGQFIIMTPDNYFFIVPEDGHKPTRYGKLLSIASSTSEEFTMLSGEHSGLLIKRYLGGTSNFSSVNDRNGTAFPDFSSTHSHAGVSILDIDRREPQKYDGIHTGTTLHANKGQQGTLSANTTCELLPLANNPNNQHLTMFVQTKNGRIFGFTEQEDATEMSPNGGFRIHELFIGQPDPNNYYRRSVSWGNSVTVTGTLNGANGIMNPSSMSSNASTGNLSLNSKTFNDTKALGKTRWLDQGHSYMQDVPTDTIYLRENTTIYAINPNTRTNITSEDFANQGTHAYHTGHSLIDPSASTSANTGVSGGATVAMENFFPSITFSEGANTLIDNPGTSSEIGWDRVGDTTFDMIYGDDSRVYLALKATVYNGVRTLNGCHTLIRFHTGKDGTELVAGVTGPHPHELNDMKTWNNSGNPTAYDRPQYRELYWYGLFSAHQNIQYGPGSSNYGQYHTASSYAAGHRGYWNEVNLVYDNKRDNVICVGRRDFNSGDSYNTGGSSGPTVNAIYSRVVAVPANGMSTVEGLNNQGTGWPGTLQGINYNNYTPRLAQDERQGAIYGASGNWTGNNADIYQSLFVPWCNSFNSSRPNGYERHGFLAGEVRNVTINGKSGTNFIDRNHPTLPNRGSQIYFSGMTIDGDTQPYSSNQYQSHGGWPNGQNRIGAMPMVTTGFTSQVEVSLGFGSVNKNHNTANVGSNIDHLYHAQIKLKNTQTVAVNSDSNEEGIRCVWYYKGAFHGVTTYNEGTYVYMPEPEHNTANNNANTVTHYVSQCESGQNSYNNVIGGQNTKIGTAEGCRNADWAACLAPGGILCIPKQDSGYNNAGFLTINLGTRQIINTNGNPPPLLGGEPFVAPSSLNPNGRQIKQMVVTSTGKIWAILDYENPSASTLQFRILQVVFNSNHTSVTWSGGLYTSQASNSNSGHVKFYRTVCGNMPQSKMEWDAV